MPVNNGAAKTQAIKTLYAKLASLGAGLPVPACQWLLAHLTAAK
jgi:hypothetical protein